MNNMFGELEEINTRPKPFEFYTANELWTNEHTSSQMLSYHLNEEVDKFPLWGWCRDENR